MKLHSGKGVVADNGSGWRLKCKIACLGHRSRGETQPFKDLIQCAEYYEKWVKGVHKQSKCICSKRPRDLRMGICKSMRRLIYNTGHSGVINRSQGDFNNKEWSFLLSNKGFIIHSQKLICNKNSADSFLKDQIDFRMLLQLAVNLM